MKKSIKNIILIISILIIAFLGYNTYKLNDELQEYKTVYDGLTIFEDGSWTYDKGVNEYYFWNWELDYIGK